MSKLLRYTLPVIALAAVACTPFPGTPAATCQSGPAIEAGVVDATNVERVKVGAPPVAIDPQLQAWAEEWAAHMADVGVLYHRTWTPTEDQTWFYGPADLIQGPIVPPQDAAGLLHGHNGGGWYSSASHREHLLYSGYTHAGIGVVCRGGSQWAAAVFGGGRL